MAQAPDDSVTEAANDVSLAIPLRLRLRVIAGPDEGKWLDLERGTYVVGSSSRSALVLSDPKVSRQHLSLRVGSDGVVTRDLGSTNGCYFLEARFSEMVLGVGATIRIGSTMLRLAPPDEAAAPASDETHFGALRGTSARMRQLFGWLERTAPTDLTVLLTGETGTGKEVCARALHDRSARARKPFVVCDLAGLSRSLLESELFGHVRGAFTGAVADRAGAFAEADGGTIFLDEVGELELDLQPRLLRALQERTVRPVGGASQREFDVRVVAATNRDLRAEVAAGRFRADLFHRLAVSELELPPLRERKEDIPYMVRNFIGARAITLPPATVAVLTAYDWPGNVRELRNVVERALSLVGDEGALAPHLLGLDRGIAPALDGEEFHAAKERLIAAWEHGYLTNLLREAGGNVSAAARKSGIARIYLHRLIKKYGLK